MCHYTRAQLTVTKTTTLYNFQSKSSKHLFSQQQMGGSLPYKNQLCDLEAEVLRAENFPIL